MIEYLQTQLMSGEAFTLNIQFRKRDALRGMGLLKVDEVGLALNSSGGTTLLVPWSAVESLEIDFD